MSFNHCWDFKLSGGMNWLCTGICVGICCLMLYEVIPTVSKLRTWNPKLEVEISFWQMRMDGKLSRHAHGILLVLTSWS